MRFLTLVMLFSLTHQNFGPLAFNKLHLFAVYVKTPELHVCGGPGHRVKSMHDRLYLSAFPPNCILHIDYYCYRLDQNDQRSLTAICSLFFSSSNDRQQ